MGRFDEAEATSVAALSIYGGDEIAQPWRGLIFQIRLFQSRLEELVPAFRERQELDSLASLSFQLARALCMVLTGEPEEARFELERSARNDFAALGAIGARVRSLELGLLAQVASLLGDATHAARLHEMLAPYDGQWVCPSVALSVGPVSLALGMLDRLLGRHHDAIVRLDAAVAVCADVGADPYAGLAYAELAHALEARRAPGDEQRANDLRSAVRTLGTDRNTPGVVDYLRVLDEARAS
jgi:hypothetical protein